jgi:TatD DNase family protein
MFVDSHCHLDFPELTERLPQVLANMAEARVEHALCVSVTLEDWPRVAALAGNHPQLSASVGVHPDNVDVQEPTVSQLVSLSRTDKIVAIGETGLDYFRATGDLEWQRDRFRVHIRAAREAGKPLIIHTRAASEDTLRIMREEHAEQAGGVMHCFTEDWDVAQAALDLGFHISMSGIVSFKNAAVVRDVATRVPEDRLLIETDSPYLAPVPHRGKTNEPAWVSHVGAAVAALRGVPVDAIAAATTANYYRLFGGR